MKSIKLLGIGVLFLTIACASYSKPHFSHTPHKYNKSFDEVWNGCLEVLSDKSIAVASKETREISTQPEVSSVINGNVSRVTTIKISPTQPYVVWARVQMVRTTAGIYSRGLAGHSEDAYSDDDAQEELLNKLDEILKK